MSVSVCLSVCLSVTEVHWRSIATLGFKFRSQFTAHCGRINVFSALKVLNDKRALSKSTYLLIEAYTVWNTNEIFSLAADFCRRVSEQYGLCTMEIV